MARRSIFGRFTRAARKIFAPSRPEPPRREPPRDQGPRGRDPYRTIWRKEHGKGSYQKNLAVFHAVVDPVENDPDELLMLWDSYVRHINKAQGRYRRQDTANMFWRDSGIDPSDMDWRRWREAMGYTGKNRSKTA
jgi:hypothetical protein